MFSFLSLKQNVFTMETLDDTEKMKTEKAPRSFLLYRNIYSKSFSMAYKCTGMHA